MTPEAAFVLTEQPVPLDIAPLEDERTPPDMVCLGTRIGGRLVARCVVPPEAAEFILHRGLFAEPVPLALAAETADPGLQCRLFAVVLLNPEELAEEEETDTEGNEPWAASVPRWEEEPARQPAEPRQAAVLLGHIVRFQKDRKHPDSLPHEAADILATIVQGRVVEVVDKVLEDLMGS
jgi:hypothetical protein